MAARERTGPSSSARSTSNRYRTSRGLVVERSQPTRGIITGVGFARDSRNNPSGRNSPRVPRNPELGDSKISTQTRILARADTEELYANAAHQIESLLEAPENRKYIIKHFSFLQQNLLDAFKGVCVVSWREPGLKIAAKLLAVILNSMENHSSIVCNWLIDAIFGALEGSKHSLPSVMRDIILGALDHMKPPQISILMKSIHEQIEEISDPPAFKLFTTIFATGILKNQSNTAAEVFTDFIDVLIGWMTDGYENELGDTYFHLYEIIQKMQPYFARELIFLGDLISSIVDFVKEAGDEKPLSCVRIIRLLKTLESLLALKPQLDKKFLKNTMERLVETMNSIPMAGVADQTQNRQFRDFLHFTNENLVRVSGIDGPAIRLYITNQMQCFDSDDLNITSWTSELLIGFLAVLNCWLETIGVLSQLPVEVQNLCGRLMGFLDKILPYFSQEDQFHVLKVTHALLRTRNITLLQNVYEWILTKLQRETPDLSNTSNKRIITANVDTQLFVLATLVDIATNKSGSILSLWALDPSILDLLIQISLESSYVSVRLSALEMLKSHCIAHSHFASNITANKIFDTETPALRFLNSLLEFWRTCLEDKDFLNPCWLVDWIALFFKSTVPYATLLIERHLKIYSRILHLISSWKKLGQSFGNLLHWMVQEENYAQSSPLQDVIRHICLKILLNHAQPQLIQEKFGQILKLLPSLILLPEELPRLQGEWRDDELEFHSAEEEPPLMAHTELNSFLQKLLIYPTAEQAKIIDLVPSKETIKSAVDFIIRSKLKTILGRAPEFFGQLALMVRKIVTKGARKDYDWKLEFVYQIQRKIHLCIYESAFLACDIPDVIRSFYVTNKTPCTGWLKRMAPECIELSLSLRRYAMAYFFAVSIGDDHRAKLALLELQDGEGLKGLGETAGYFYLNSEYEKAEESANAVVVSGPDPVSELLLEKTKLIFEGSASKLQVWPPPAPSPAVSPQVPDLTQLSITPAKIPLVPPRPPWNSRLLQLPIESTRTLLSLQLALLGSRPETEVIGSLESFSKLKLYEMVQVEDLILTSRKFSMEDKRRIQNCKLQKMIECGNLKWLRNWITISGWLDMDQLDLNLEKKVNTFRILGDLLYKEQDFFEAGTLYSCVLELIIEKDGVDVRGHSPPIIPNDFKASFYLAFAEKVKNSDTFYERAVTKSGLLAALEGKHQTRQELFDRARESSRNSTTQVRADVWYQYATFAYERSGDGNLTPVLKEVLTSNALHSYANFIKWNQKKQRQEDQRGKIMMAMIRLVKLYNQNHKFIAEDLVTSELWLNILPELAKIEELRPYIVGKFPWAASFLVASLEYVRRMKRFSRRRGLFDPITYAYTEATEDPFEVKNDQPNLCILETGKKTFETNIRDYWTNDLRVKNVQGQQENSQLTEQLRDYLRIVEEIERTGTTKEELWAEVIQRGMHDWAKRMNALKRDLARDRGDQGGNPEKIRVYLRPITVFFKEMWRKTMESDTPADIAFIYKHRSKIEEILNGFDSCKSLDSLTQIQDKLQQCALVFDSTRSSKLSLANVSPILSQWTFGDPNTTGITLPGMNEGVTISSVQNAISCLHTKTNPKRIGIRGSNGRIYEYLIKGNENLHIDAGIMQLLRVTEEFSGCPTRHYSVVPIGERGGLIQIVPNAVPLFVMYKKFLQRNNATERPSDIFWRRLESLGFKDRGDLEGLKEVYNSLKEETPRDLISRDLLMCAENTMEWYKAVKTYTRDCAMGAAMGHTLELADRHLDNILIDLRHGNLTHVDFSILFGKGVFLKVPERVPFRLTQNIVDALQYPGIHGPFAVYLDKFLEKYKNEKEMTLFCVRNIAIDAQLDEGIHIPPEIILGAEIASTLDLIRLRVKNVWRMMEIVMTEILECVTQVKDTSSVWNMTSPRSILEKLRKRLNRWRRLLANLDPLIMFVILHTTASGSLAGFHQLVLTKWIPEVMHFWSHTETSVIVQAQSLFQERFRVCEEILQGLLHEISKGSSEIEICPGPIVNSGEQRVDTGKLEAIMNSAESRISAHIPLETANLLIAEATKEDNLAQMYEGWIPWV